MYTQKTLTNIARIIVYLWAVGWIAFIIIAGLRQDNLVPADYLRITLIPLAVFLLPAYISWVLKLVGGIILIVGSIVLIVIFAITMYSGWFSVEELIMSLLLYIPPLISGIIFIISSITSKR